ncbi:glutamine--fructose-6-phosphate transaminase (isomerizing), partial [Candidatus Woesearchaeota archaeon]|nr:glutamine--fructose-6-phosphate transaminase (isomerizing) [Candidatus Woesearchaeota archaeon]
MCGILGIVSKKPFSIKTDLMMSLKRLEYRGYDSVGYATSKGNIVKDVGQIDKFLKKAKGNADVAISHTRWATHGGVTKANAHPHSSENFIIVHNGIIENYPELKKKLAKKGYKQKSQTDSELIAFYFEDKYKHHTKIETAIRQFFHDIKGTFAVLLIKKGDNKIYAFKRESPLVLGIAKDRYYLASDIYAFSNKTNKAIFFEDDEYAVIEKHRHMFYNKNGRKLNKRYVEFRWGQAESRKKKYKHYMLKEIHEEPYVAEHLIHSLRTDQKKQLIKLKHLIDKASRVYFVAAGTSFHASMIGSHFLNQYGVKSSCWIASEFDVPKLVNSKTLMIVVSQSGETMDIVEAIKFAKQKKAKVASIVNVPFSTVQRLSDVSINSMAGQEICVAATKSYVNQAIIMLALAKLYGYKIHLATVPHVLQESLRKNENFAKKIAKKIYKREHMYVLGRGLCFAAALEIALKIKEISYMHAEGMRGGELKHGTIALIEKGTPVISLIPKGNSEMRGNAKEVEARGAFSIKIT